MAFIQKRNPHWSFIECQWKLNWEEMQSYHSDKIMSFGECVWFLNFLLVCLFRLQALVCVCVCFVYAVNALGNIGNSHSLTDSINSFIDSYLSSLVLHLVSEVTSPCWGNEEDSSWISVCFCLCVSRAVLDIYHNSCGRPVCHHSPFLNSSCLLLSFILVLVAAWLYRCCFWSQQLLDENLWFMFLPVWADNKWIPPVELRSGGLIN